jgi:hypothetical protein
MGKKLRFILAVYTVAKYIVCLGILYSFFNVATVMCRVTPGVYTLKSYFFHQSDFFFHYFVVHYFRVCGNETRIYMLCSRPTPAALRKSCQCLNSALLKWNKKEENKSIGVSRDTAVILQQALRMIRTVLKVTSL